MVFLRALLLLFLFLGGSALACSDEPDLALFVSDSPDPVSCNEEVVYTVVVENRAPTTKTNLELAFYMLDEDFDFVEAVSNDGWSCSYDAAQNLVICNKDFMAPGESNAVQITFRAGGLESRYANAYVHFSSLERCDCDYVETCESTQVECTPCESLAVSLTGTPPQSVGDEFQVLLQVENPAQEAVAFDVYWSSNLSFLGLQSSVEGLSCQAFSDHLHCCLEASSWSSLNITMDFKALAAGDGFVEVRNFSVGDDCSALIPCPDVLSRFSVNVPGEAIIILDPWGTVPNPFEEFIRVVGEPRTFDY